MEIIAIIINMKEPRIIYAFTGNFGNFSVKLTGKLKFNLCPWAWY